MAIDPVCGMEIDERAALSTEYDSTTQYFCSEQCRAEFLQDPEAFLRSAA